MLAVVVYTLKIQLKRCGIGLARSVIESLSNIYYKYIVQQLNI